MYLWKVSSCIVLLLASSTSSSTSVLMNSQSFIATATPSLTTAESMESIIRPTSTFSSQSPLPTFPVSVIQTTATKVSTAATGTNQAPTATTSPEPQPKLFVWVIGSAGIILFIAVVVVVATVCTCCVVLRRRKRTRPNIKSNGMSVIVNEGIVHLNCLYIALHNARYV